MECKHDREDLALAASKRCPGNGQSRQDGRIQRSVKLSWMDWQAGEG